jgi:SAM-dependent MidA family methyltransferase
MTGIPIRRIVSMNEKVILKTALYSGATRKSNHSRPICDDRLDQSRINIYKCSQKVRYMKSDIRITELGKPALVKKVLAEIQNAGQVTFARFMETVLYDPEEGYYNAARDPIGREGDYDTSPEVHSVFGRMIGKQLIQMLESLHGNEPLTLFEMGAGRGLLISHILGAIKHQNHNLFDALQCIIIERSPSMISRQKERLIQAGLKDKVNWHDTLKDIKTREGMVGCVLSNELLDAFPVHRVVMTGQGLKEIYVTVIDGEIKEIIDEPSTPDLSSYFERIKVGLDQKQQAEVNLEAAQWINEIGQVLKNGYVLTLDYGHTAADLYASHRKKGTLLCYYRHTVHENPYIRIGEQDITAHIDFTSLALEGRKAKFEVTGFTDQQHFLMSLGIAEEMEGLDHKSSEFKAMKRLMADDRMGRTFKVLIQHKGITPPELQGLQYKPFFKDALWR